MSAALFSPYWHRASKLHPCLASNVAIHRQCFRGEVWYVVANQITGRQYRVNHLGYQIVGRLDGTLSVQQIWDLLALELGADAPTQDEVLTILSQLTSSGMLRSEATPELERLFDAAKQRVRADGKFNPLMFRISLFDPTALLEKAAPLFRPLFQRWLLYVWVACALTTAVVAGMHWSELANYGAVHWLSPRNMLLLWIAYPFIKALHEFGHAIAIKIWGGEVHEVGINMMFCIPVPFVDATAASAFSEKHRRILVSAMGILFEGVIAFIALALWLSCGNGLLREIAFACLSIAGFATLLVNANPLMRYDGYYMLADALEMPALATRCQTYWRYLGERYVLGNTSLPIPAGAMGVRAWLCVYGIAASLYRVGLLIKLVFWVGAKYFLAGAALGLYLIARYCLQPLLQLAHFVLRTARLQAIRTRAVGIVAASALAALMFVCAIPQRHFTYAEGVTWLADEARVHNRTEGFVTSVLVHDGDHVSVGQPLLVLENTELNLERDQLLSRIARLETTYYSQFLEQPSQAIALAEELNRATADLANLDTRLHDLTIVSPMDGKISIPHVEDLPGRYIERGSAVAHIVTPEPLRIRAVIEQADIDLVRRNSLRYDVRIAEQRSEILSAKLVQAFPAATRELPAAVLGDRAGGSLVSDPNDPKGLRTLDSFFVIDVSVGDAVSKHVGSRAWLRIEHGRATLAEQWTRRLRQTFLRQFSPDVSASAQAAVEHHG